MVQQYVMSPFGATKHVKNRSCALQDAAWSSFALMRNTNTSCVVISLESKIFLARGAFARSVVAGRSSKEALEALSEVGNMTPDATLPASPCYNYFAVVQGMSWAQEVATPEQTQAYYPDSASIASAGGQIWEQLSPSCESLLVQPFTANNSDQQAVLLLLSDTPRAWTQQGRAWAKSITEKLALTL